MIDPRLFVSDLDGTLLLPDKTLGPRSRDVVQRFIDAGGHFTVATGRSAPSTATLLAGLRLELDAIANNGALTVNLASGAVSDLVAVPGKVAGAIFSAARESGLAPIAYALDERDCTVLLHGPPAAAPANAPTRSYLASLVREVEISVDDGSRLGELRGLSILILDEPDRLRTFFADRCASEAEVSTVLGKSSYTPGLGVGEIQSARTSKARAAVRLARSLGLGAEQIVAFGDNHNDLPLLRAAGEAYCPENAPEEVRAEIGRTVASSAEEGVARFLEALLPPRSFRGSRTGSPSSA
jgi:5-amino-6-(5-phospho-D-ribitylamino)uracil phosphatase